MRRKRRPWLRQPPSDEPPAGATRWSLHHGSHCHLITRTQKDRGPIKDVDAIIVPTARPVAYLATTMGLAEKLGCVLVTLCSQHASKADARNMASDRDVRLMAIDVGDIPSGLVPPFETDALLVGTPFGRHSDLSLKRNLGLAIARFAGWERVVFLDDDIAVPSPNDLSEAVSLLGEFAAVGLTVQGFPDNSVVCHAYREIGGDQKTFVGGGALAVAPPSTTSFFPNIYNEDWLFLLDGRRLLPTAITGGVEQQPYDPFANDRRARAEEFGECIAEGLYWVLDQGSRVTSAGKEHWTQFLDHRRAFIDHVIDGATALHNAASREPDIARYRRMLTSLKAARGRCTMIEAEFCQDYVAAWRRDRRRWRSHLGKLSQRQSGEARPPRPSWRGAEARKAAKWVVAGLGLLGSACLAGRAYTSHRAATTRRQGS